MKRNDWKALFKDLDRGLSKLAELPPKRWHHRLAERLSFYFFFLIPLALFAIQIGVPPLLSEPVFLTAFLGSAGIGIWCYFHGRQIL